MPIDISFLQSNQTLIPFLFVLAIIFGVLEITNVFRNRGVNFLVALAISFFTITNTTFVNFLWSQFGNITAFFLIMFFIAFIFELFGLRRPRASGQESRAPEALVINGAILFILLTVGFLYVEKIPSLPYIGSGQNLLIAIVIFFVLVLFWAAFKAGPQFLPAEEKHKGR